MTQQGEFQPPRENKKLVCVEEPTQTQMLMSLHRICKLINISHLKI